MKKLVFVAAVLALFACEKEIEYEGEGKAPVLVLDAILENGSVPLVHVSRSVFFLSNSSVSDASISNAEVKLTNVDSGTEYVLAGGGNGYYYGTDAILPNTRYRIEVSHPDYETISSELVTVSNVVLSDIDSSSVGVDYEKRYFVNFHFNDAQETNFYAIQLSAEKETTYFDANMNVVDADTTWMSPYPTSNDPSVDFRFNQSVFFNDDIFNGSAKVFPLEFNHYSLYNGTYGGGVSWVEQEMQVIGYQGVLRSLSEDTYKYFKSIENNDGSSPFSDPVNVHTNVQNGLGIFGSVSTSVFEL